MTDKKRTKYYVLLAGEWCSCTKAAAQPSGWLHYQLKDGTVGLAQPKNWTKGDKPKPKGKV